MFVKGLPLAEQRKAGLRAPVDSTAKERRLMGITSFGVQAMKPILFAILLPFLALTADKQDEAEKQGRRRNRAGEFPGVGAHK
jgi:hypothetical protein